MRTAIFLGALVIAQAIRSHEMSEREENFYAAVLLVMMAIDVLEVLF